MPEEQDSRRKLCSPSITLSQIPEGIFSHLLFIQQMFNKYALNMTALQVQTDLLCPHRSSILVEESGAEQPTNTRTIVVLIVIMLNEKVRGLRVSQLRSDIPENYPYFPHFCTLGEHLPAVQ